MCVFFVSFLLLSRVYVVNVYVPMTCRIFNAWPCICVHSDVLLVVGDVQQARMTCMVTAKMRPATLLTSPEHAFGTFCVQEDGC